MSLLASPPHHSLRLLTYLLSSPYWILRSNSLRLLSKLLRLSLLTLYYRPVLLTLLMRLLPSLHSSYSLLLHLLTTLHLRLTSWPLRLISLPLRLATSLHLALVTLLLSPP